MKRNHIYWLLFFFLIGRPAANAQQKLFSFGELFQGQPTGLLQPLPSIRGWADDNHYLEWRKDGQTGTGMLMSVDVKTGEALPYEKNLQREEKKHDVGSMSVSGARNTTLSPDGNWAAYTKKDNNLYLFDRNSGHEYQLTHDGSENILNGYASWVYYEEILGRSSHYKAFWWSGDSKKLCFMRFDDSEVPVFPIYWSDGQHGFIEKEHYPKAGDNNPEVTLGIAGISDPRHITWAGFDPKNDQYFGAPYWTPDNRLWVQWMNRGQDTLKIYEVDQADGSRKEIYSETQKTWIDLDEANRIEFLDKGRGFLLKSDKDGWENFYRYDMNGKLLNQVTTGSFWGSSIVRVDEAGGWLYFRARHENSARFDFYKVKLDGSKLKRLSFGDYSHDDISLSPRANYFITTYSNLSTPPQMALADARSGKVIRVLGSMSGRNYNDYELPRAELLRVKSDDGIFDLPVQITYPVHFDSSKSYPVLISIYGGPNAGTVYDRWKNPLGPTQWWAQEGIIQVAFDNRSSGHFGKAGLNYIYRQLGKYEIEDFMTCARWLRKQSWVDSNKLAITGGSFGGYMTCMALTYGAGVFNYGIANSSVTDWQLYDTHYTERYMDRPSENPEGYKRTAVNTYVDRYKGLLRIVHGSADDNVHMQNSLQLIDKMEESGKHFELMIYPGERHGIGGNSFNKRRHLMMESFRFYYENLLNKPLPPQFNLDSKAH